MLISLCRSLPRVGCRGDAFHWMLEIAGKGTARRGGGCDATRFFRRLAFPARSGSHFHAQRHLVLRLRAPQIIIRAQM